MTSNDPAPAVAKPHALQLALDTVKPSTVALLGEQQIDYVGFELAVRAACRKNVDLMNCLANDRGRKSFQEQVLFCARIGLVPDPQLHHFAFVPFGGEVVGIIEFRGLLHLMLQTGQYEDVGAEVTYQQELKRGQSWLKPDGMPDHQPSPFERDGWPDGDIVGAYAWAKVRGRDRPVVVTLSTKQILARSKNRNKLYETHRQQMFKKAALRALGGSGLVPIAGHGRLLAALQSDEDETVPAAVQTIEPPPTDKPPELAHMDAADALNFQQREKDPLPSAEDMHRDTYEQIVALAKEKGMKPDVVDVIAENFCGKRLTDVGDQEHLAAILKAVRESAPVR